MPKGVLGDTARATASQVQKTVSEFRADWQKSFREEQVISVGIFVSMSIGSLLMALALSILVARPLRYLTSLGALMRRLGALDFAHEDSNFMEIRRGQRSVIKEVSELQDTFYRLSNCIETFAHFVPEGVVRKIVKGGEKERRPHVSMRTVTIMFTDIRDFTAISETLSQTDLLFVLTRYLTAMTGVAEHYRGEVTEILGDGLLIFWNTPEDVPDHAAKACAAALAMQEALASLNEELQSRDFPRLSIRCGLHTGFSYATSPLTCSRCWRRAIWDACTGVCRVLTPRKCPQREHRLRQKDEVRLLGGSGELGKPFGGPLQALWSRCDLLWRHI
mmetsp:Transcript_21054/g.68192  ORF Transcript_21054/g.68192 Transcript_21054/m.68192 type:complete len:333 (-) Transcript_21054:796-1794(-)